MFPSNNCTSIDEFNTEFLCLFVKHQIFYYFVEMREKFNNGEDPLDPEQQQQQGSHGHPFFHGFNPFEGGFGGGGGNFKFHFN